MISCTKRIEFDAAHRIPNHAGKCRMLHGHRYVVEASFVAKPVVMVNDEKSVKLTTVQQLNSMGMVVDFACIKKLLGTWIDQNWDHNTILSEEDRAFGFSIEQYTGQRVFYMDCYPTTENLSNFLLDKVCPQLFREQKVICNKVRLYEGSSSYCDALSSSILG